MSEDDCIAFVLSAPSGAGKTTLAAALLDRVDGLQRTISWTTREARPGEVDRVDYTFVTEEEFRRERRAGGFLESFEVHGNLYGTPRSEIERIRDTGDDALLVIDVQGAAAARHRLDDPVTIFVLPPSRAELEERLGGRDGGDPAVEAEVRQRLGVAVHEIEQFVRYDYVVINDVFEQAVQELEAVVLAERCRRQRRTRIAQEILESFR